MFQIYIVPTSIPSKYWSRSNNFYAHLSFKNKNKCKVLYTFLRFSVKCITRWALQRDTHNKPWFVICHAFCKADIAAVKDSSMWAAYHDRLICHCQRGPVHTCIIKTFFKRAGEWAHVLLALYVTCVTMMPSLSLIHIVLPPLQTTGRHIIKNFGLHVYSLVSVALTSHGVRMPVHLCAMYTEEERGGPMWKASVAHWSCSLSQVYPEISSTQFNGTYTM